MRYSILYATVLFTYCQISYGIDAPNELGVFEPVKRESPFTLAAPHGDFDTNTGEITKKVCEDLPWNCLIAYGFRKVEHPYNVNRPTEGYGLSYKEEIHSTSAQLIYKAFVDHLWSFGSELPKLYIEIHGNNSPRNLERIELATVGITADEGIVIRDIFKKHFADTPLANLHPAVEAVEPILYRGTASKKWGSLSVTPKSLMIEFPNAPRTTHKDALSEKLLLILNEIGEHY